MPFYDFNHCDYHELPLDYIMKLARESMGLKLKVVGDTLQLVNDAGQALSTVTVSYSEKALTDTLGHDIKTYLISVSDVNNQLVFVKGNGDVVYVTPSFATKAEKDVNNHNIVDYVYNVSIAGDKLRITKGDQAILDLTLPFATKAATDINSKDLTSYAATLAVDGNNVVLRDSLGRLLNSITVPFATNATNAVNAEEAEHADDADHADEADHASDSDTADYATLSTDATNAVETVTISGNNMIFTTFGGQSYTITCPYSLKSLGDSLGNKISETYVANVTQDSNTNKIQFWDAEGNLIVELLPTVDKAVHDSYNNLIADYIKSISVQTGSNYVTVVHGTGTTDTLVIQYSETALKDSQGSVIKNTYVTELECIEDVDDGHYKLVWYNNDNPKSEIGRCEVYAYAAQYDINGKLLTSYVADIDITNNNIVVKDGENNTLETLPIPDYYLDTDDTYIELHRGSELISNFPVPTIQITVEDNGIDPWTYSNTVLTNDISINMSSYAVLNALTDNAAVLVDYAGDMHIATAKSQIQRSSTITTVFESEIANGKFWKVDLTTTPSGNLVSCVGDVVSVSGTSTLAGLSDVDVTGVTDGQVLTYDANSSEWVPTTPGGGGGSSTTILGLYDPNQGNLIKLGDASQNQTVEVWDITDINNPVPLEDTDVLPKIEAGPCYFKDSRYNTYSIVYDATATRIGVIFNAADMPYYISIAFQYGTYWSIATKKYFALQ